MNSIAGHSCILAGAGIAAYAMSFGLERPERAATSEPTPVVVSVPQRTPQPAARTPAAASPTSVAMPGDREGLARELHRELKRVGCYDGEISGAWSAPSRKAMKAFTEHVNATLPVDQPDYILLRLLQGHQGRACGVVAGAAAQPPPPEAKLAEPPAVVAPLPVAPAPKLRSEGNVPLTPPRPEPAQKAPARQAALEPVPRSAPAAVRDVPVPAVGVYEDGPQDRPKRAAARPPKPPKFVRVLVRGVQQALAPFGIR